MSNEIVKSEIPYQDMMSMAKLFAESKMFKDVTQAAQAFVKIQAGKEIGIAPFAAMSGINIIMNKLTISAGLMAGCVKASGKYDYKVMKLDETICSIDFLQGGHLIGNSTFTKEDAAKAGTQNMAKYPRNMLFARAMSNGQKWFCPDVFTMPVYTPEEMGDPSFTEDIAHEEVAEQVPAPPVKTTLNPKAIKDAVARIAAGEVDLIEKIQETFNVTEKQIAELKAAVPQPSTLIITPADGAAIVDKA